MKGWLHYFLPYVWHFSPPNDGVEWKVWYFKGCLPSEGRWGCSGTRGDGQCDKGLSCVNKASAGSQYEWGEGGEDGLLMTAGVDC